MLIGHLTLFGLAEAFVTGGLVAYLQRNGPDLLERTAPARRDGSATAIPAGGWRATRP